MHVRGCGADKQDAVVRGMVAKLTPKRKVPFRKVFGVCGAIVDNDAGYRLQLYDDVL